MTAFSSTRGFVLSMSLFMLAVFLLLFAQLYAEHSFDRQFDQSQLWSDARPLRVAVDAGRDLNLLLDQRIALVQSEDDVNVHVRGRLPSPLSMQANLLRYQSSLSAWASDQNVYAFLDLNSTISDGNITGFLENGYYWKEKLNTSRIHFYPSASIAIPSRIDINISAESTYTDANAWSLSSDGNTYVTLRYTDQNTSHTTTSTGYILLGDTHSYTWRFSNGTYGIRLDVGRLNDVNGSVIIDHNGYSSFDATYSVALSFDANVTPSRVGYVIPLTVIGSDANVVSPIQWG